MLINVEVCGLSKPLEINDCIRHMLELSNELPLFRLHILCFIQSDVHIPCNVFTPPRFTCFIWLPTKCGILICYCNSLKWKEISVILLLLRKLLPENLIESTGKAAMKRKVQAIFHSLYYGLTHIRSMSFLQQTVWDNEYQFHACYTQASLIAHLFLEFS